MRLANLIRGLTLRDDAEDFGGVGFGSDEGPEFLDFSGFADDERTADDAHGGAAHELFFLPDAELLNGLVGWIAEQWEIEFVLFLEPSMRFEWLGDHAQAGEFGMCDLPIGFTKLDSCSD